MYVLIPLSSALQNYKVLFHVLSFYVLHPQGTITRTPTKPFPSKATMWNVSSAATNWASFPPPRPTAAAALSYQVSFFSSALSYFNLHAHLSLANDFEGVFSHCLTYCSESNDSSFFPFCRSGDQGHFVESGLLRRHGHGDPPTAAGRPLCACNIPFIFYDIER